QPTTRPAAAGLQTPALGVVPPVPRHAVIGSALQIQESHAAERSRCCPPKAAEARDRSLGRVRGPRPDRRHHETTGRKDKARGQLPRRSRCEVTIPPQYGARFANRIGPAAHQNLAQWMHSERELGYDAEISATASDRPEKIRLGIGTDVAQLTIGDNDIHG